MAEVLGVVASGVAVSQIAGQVTKSIFKLKMTKNAEELGLRKLSKKEATKQATKEVQEEKADRLLATLFAHSKGSHDETENFSATPARIECSSKPEETLVLPRS